MHDKLVKNLEVLCDELRGSIFDITKQAQSGHTGGCSSSVELMTTLYFGGVLRYNPSNPQDVNRDRVLVRGHLGPLRYRIFSLLGWIDEAELSTYRQLESRLEGHEDMNKVPGVDITPSGSLGMVLSYGAGAAIAAIKQKKDFLTYVFLGDGEEQEGNVSEAARHIASKRLNNIIAVIDKNGKQLSHPTSYSDSAADLKKIWEGYGWDVREVFDGHNLNEVLSAYEWARNRENKPKLIIAHTLKGKGLEGCESHYSGYHTVSTVKPERIEEAVSRYNSKRDDPKLQNSLSELKTRIFVPQTNRGFAKTSEVVNISLESAHHANMLGGLVEYFQKLNKEFAERPENLYVLTADIIRDELIPVLGLDNPETTFVDVGIREQHMTATAHGISVTDPFSRVLIDAGEEFLYRNADQLNVLAQAKSPVVIIGNMGGICGAKNGSTHQPSGQSGMLTLMPQIKSLEPADNRDLFDSLNYALSQRNEPVYIRMHSGPLPKIVPPQRNISYYLVRDSENPEIVLIGNGLTLKGCVDASGILKEEGIDSRVINVVDRESLDDGFTSMLARSKPVLTVYNGNSSSLSYPVSHAIMKSKSQSRPSQIFSHGFTYGKSGSLEDLIKYFKFDGSGISEIVKTILR